MKKYRVVLTQTVILDHAEYMANNEKDAEKRASMYFNNKELYDDETNMEIEEVE